MNINDSFIILYQDEFEKLKTPIQMAIYVAIKSYCANGKRDYPLSIREIHKRSKVSIGWIKTTIQELISLSLIEITGTEGHRGGLVNVYHINRKQEEINKKNIIRRYVSFNERDKEITKDYRTMTLSNLGKKYHMTYQNVHLIVKKYAKKHNMDFSAIIRERRRHPKTCYTYTLPETSEKRRNKIITAYYKGWAVKKISRYYKITPKQIYTIYKKFGINVKKLRHKVLL